MIEYVLLGRAATIRAQHNAPAPAATASVTLYRATNAGRRVLTNATFPLVGGAGAYQWPSTGLEPDEMSCPVYWEVTINGNLAGQGVFVVYRDRIEVLVVDVAPPNDPLPHALSRLAVESDRGWAAETGYQGPTSFTANQAASLEGKLDYPGLPHGQHAITFRPPYFLKEWRAEGEYTKTGPKRKAVVEKRYCAVIVSPQPGDAPRRQWVNLDPDGADDDAARDEKGSALTVRVRVRDADGGGLAGDKVWVRATYDAGNSKRTGDPRPTFAGDAVERGQSYLKEFTLDADRAVIDVPLELGLAGGDRVTILVAGHAGVSDDSHDDKLVIENWRRVWLRYVSPTGFNALHLPDEMKALAKGALEPAFIDLVTPSVPVRFDTPGNVGCQTVTGDIAAGMKLPADATNLVYTFSVDNAQSDVAKAFEGAYDASRECPAYPPTLFAVLGQGLFKKAKVQSFTFKVRGRGKHQIETDTGFFLLRDWTGADSVQPLADNSASYWGQGAERTPVTYEYFTPDATHRALTFAIPEGAANRPSWGSNTEYDVRLRVQVYGSVAGSSAGRWLCFWYNRDSDTARVGYALVHEIGHCLGQAVLEPQRRGLGPEARNELAYEFSGWHCSKGVAGLDRTNTTETHSERGFTGRVEVTREVPWHSRVSWDEVIDSGRQGSCVMFSPVGAKTRYPAQPAFCDVCLEYLKAADLRRITRA